MAEKFLQAAKLRRMRVEQLSTPATDSQVTVADEDPELRRIRIMVNSWGARVRILARILCINSLYISCGYIAHV